jgi:hypothetical protein
LARDSQQIVRRRRRWRAHAADHWTAGGLSRAHTGWPFAR